MQPIERYALVTLLFLVVLVMVVALWDDGSKAGAAGDHQEVARIEEPRTQATGAAQRAAGASSKTSNRPPVGGRDEIEARANRVRTRGGMETRHRVEPGGASSEFGGEPPVAQSAADLKGTLSPIGNKNRATMDPIDFDAGSKSASLVSEGDVGRGRGRTNNSAAAASMKTPARPADPRRSSESVQPSPPVDRLAKKEAISNQGGNGTAAGPRDYVIRSGDSFGLIASRELGDARAAAAIASLNGLSLDDTIYEGRTLKLPPRSDVAKRDAASAQPPTAAPGGGRSVYTFKSGDTLSVVLQEKFGTYKRSIALVKKLNPGMNPDRIVEGARIVLPRTDEIPGGVKVAKATTAPSAPRTRRAASTKNEFVVR